MAYFKIEVTLPITTFLFVEIPEVMENKIKQKLTDNHKKIEIDDYVKKTLYVKGVSNILRQNMDKIIAAAQKTPERDFNRDYADTSIVAIGGADITEAKSHSTLVKIEEPVNG